MEEEVSLAEKVSFLGSGRAFPDCPDRVESVETHFAWVFLSPRFVYKLKKPIRFGLIDFRDREARRAYCELEVTLNRRLAEDTYLRVVPLVRTERGLAVGDDAVGDDADGVVDWLVVMRRLPSGATLADVGCRASDADLGRIMGKLVEFYMHRAIRAPWDGPGYVDALERSSAATARGAITVGGQDRGLPHDTVRRIAALQQEFVERNRPLLERRAREHRIVDAHGDLRAEHVFMTDAPQVIDCLEFSVALRWLDAAEEIAFLALDCDRLGAPETGARLLEAYRRLANDPVPQALLHFYRSRRALARAVLYARRVPDAASDADQWRARARWYLDAAEKSIVAASRP